MEPISFCFWLNGFVELYGLPPTPEQWTSIKEHLGLVFHKVTKPKTEEPNTLLTGTKLKMLDLILEGPICGLAPEVNKPYQLNIEPFKHAVDITC